MKELLLNFFSYTLTSSKPFSLKHKKELLHPIQDPLSDERTLPFSASKPLLQKRAHLLILSGFLFVTANLFAQNPGGVATAPTIWYQASSYAATWPNTGSLGSAANLKTTGSPTFSSTGDALSNYNPYILFSATGQYASTPSPGLSLANVTTLGNIHTTFAAVTNQNTSSNNTASSSPFFFGTSGGTLDQPGLGFSQNGNANNPIYAMLDYYYHTTGGTEYSYQYTGNSITPGSSVVLMGQANPVAPGTNNLNISHNGNGTTTYLNGLGQTYSLGAASGNYSSVAGGTNANQNYIFVGDVNQWAMTGRVQEIVMFNTLLSNTQTKQVNTYLGVKNGVTLGHDYVDAAGNTIYSLSSNTGYTSNIFGIGAESANGSLNQPKSNSVSDSQRIVVSNGSNIGTNDSYLLFGGNGASATSQRYVSGTVFGGNSVTTTSLLNAISETWITQSTIGGVAGGAWTVSIDASKVAQSGYVLVSSNPAFPAATTSAYALSSGVASNVSIPSGTYVTIAYLQITPGGTLTTPAAWYKPDGVIATTWTDASVNGLNLTATGTPTVTAGDAAHNFNTWTTGYSPTNYFNYTGANYSVFGGSAGSTGVGTPINSPLTVFGAARATSATTGEITGIDNDVTYGAEPGLGVQVIGSKLYPRMYRYTNGIDQNTSASGPAVMLNQTSVYTYQPPSGTGNLIMGLNGTETSISGVNTTSSVVGSSLKIGYDGFTFGAFSGDIQEIVWYKSTLSASDINKVETYLALKVGTTLTHDYVDPNGNILYSLTTNSGYTSNIAGLARDLVNGNLDQRQSNSINSGTQVLIGTTGLGNNNVNNAVDLSTDGQYLLWGDNGLTKAPSVAIAGVGAANYRFAAVWATQNTGSVGTVRVAWPVSFPNLTLVQSSDPTFASGNTATNMSANTITINGTTYNYADVTLPSGQYFTFAATIAHAPGGVVNNLSYWFRADQNATNTGNGTSVTSWTDYVYGNATATQLGTNAMPQYNIGSATYFNFNPGLNFTNGAQALGNTAVQTVTNNAYDIFTLTLQGVASGGANPRIFSSLVDNSQTTGNLHYWDGIGLNADGNIERENVGYTLHYYANPGNINYATNSSSIMYNTFTNNTVAKGLNGATVGATGNMGPFGYLNGGFAFGSTQFSSNGSDNAGFVGSLGETIIYGAGNVSANERNRVDAYLAMKYGLTLNNAISYLSSASTVVWDKTANATYYNNIISIARDDISALNQQIATSQTTATTDIITIGTDANATGLNGSHTAVGADQSFFIVGNNQGSITTNTTFTYNASNYKRVTRIWESQYTNFGQAAYITVPTANLTTALGAPPAGNAYALVSASDAGFTTNVQLSALSTSGTNSYGSINPAGGTGTLYFSFAVVSSSALATPVAYSQTINNVATWQYNIANNAAGYPSVPVGYKGILGSKTGAAATVAGVGTPNTAGNSMPLLGSESGGSIASYTIASVASGTLLYYNNGSGWQQLIAGSSLPVNYDPTQLVIYASTNGSTAGASFTYYAVDNTSVQSATPATFSLNTPNALPVTLTDFKAALQPDNSVLLSWITAGEINNSGFSVQRSANGTSGWSSLGFVSSKAKSGNSNALLNYSYIDMAPIGGAANYYRLQQEDLNGNKTYSNVVSISIIETTAGLKAYPNPAHAILNVSGLVIGNAVQIISVNGQVCQQFTVTATSQQINVSNLAAGVYILKTIASNGATQFVKFVVK